VERRYVAPRAGLVFAAFVWFAFAAFAAWRFGLDKWFLATPVTAFGVLAGLWLSVGTKLLHAARNVPWFRSLFLAWELAALAAAIVIVVT
jgi:hypothetical protein